MLISAVQQSIQLYTHTHTHTHPLLFLGGLPNLGIEPRSPVLQADSLPDEPQGKPKNVHTTTQLHSSHTLASKLSVVAQSCLTLCDPMDCTRLRCPWDSPGKNTGVGGHFLLQGIF